MKPDVPTVVRRLSAKRLVLSALPTPRSDADPDEQDEFGEQRWVARPAAARIVQLVVLAVPVLGALGCAALLSASLPRATDVGSALLWWAVVVVGSTIALVLIDRVARRLLPLAVLLRLSLLFPDQAPRRYRVAARAWSSRRLREQLESHDERPTAPADAAAQIVGLLASLAAHDRRTRGHCERVRAYNDLLAEELGLSKADRERLRWAALIHDIGKLKVSRRLLNKPSRPTAHEWHVLRAHPRRGAEIARPLADWLGPWAAAIEQHHERWDGEGYPAGLAGTDISLGARIVAVADAFEVMTSLRPYSRPVSPEKARTELAACAGAQFDPMVVRAFLSISLGRLRKAMGPVVWLTQVPLLAGMPRLQAAFIGSGPAAAGAGAGAVVAIAGGPAAVPADASPPPAPPAIVEALPPVPVMPPSVPVAERAPVQDEVTVVTRHHHHARATATHRHHHAAAADHRAATSTSPTSDGRSRGTTAGPRAETTQSDVADGTGHRCEGNGGNGLGNGAVDEPGSRLSRMPERAREALEKASGLHACD